MNIVQFSLIFLIRLYQAVISPALAAVLGPSARCRFTPSCSHYAREAVRLHGAILGGWLALRRLGRCHPWGQCGEDPVPAGPMIFVSLMGGNPHPGPLPPAGEGEFSADQYRDPCVEFAGPSTATPESSAGYSFSLREKVRMRGREFGSTSLKLHQERPRVGNYHGS